MHQTIKRVPVSDLGMRKFVRRWIPHDLSEVNRRERVFKANLLLEELRAGEGNEFANAMTGDESRFRLSYESDSMFATLTFNFDQITFEDLQWVFFNWMERLSWVIEHDGAYFQE
jgi:hypothetical protein